MSYVGAAMTFTSAFSQVQAGRNARGMAEIGAKQSDYQAQVEQENALKTAAIIRRAGTRQVAQASAAFVGAGVKVGEGSAREVERDITQAYESDAFQALLDGGRRASSLRTEAGMQRIGGRMAETAGYVNAVGTVMGGAYQSYTGWKTRNAQQYNYNGDASGTQFSRSGDDIRGRR